MMLVGDEKNYKKREEWPKENKKERKREGTEKENID